ncbi:hypothetical protein E4U49_001444 [Claviceps purpurea]|nr:hypothetical protein E4U49_001444 [Claviceps purpurea]
MRFFVALAFACGTLATAVLPLGTADEAHDILSSESDIQRAGFDIETAPDMAVADLEARHLLDNRAERAYAYRRNVRIPRDSNDGGLPVARPIDFYGVRLDFIMAEREIEQGDDVTTQWYCKAIRITNKGPMRRLVTALESVAAGTRVSGKPLFRKFMPRRTVQVVELPENLLQFELSITSAPGRG